jgi:hypothetical protein
MNKLPRVRLRGDVEGDYVVLHMHGLLEFPTDLVVENEREPSWDPEALQKLFAPPRN